MERSFVVTGGGRGVGRAIARRLARDGAVVVLELDPAAVTWADGYADVHAVCGDAGDVVVAERAAAVAAEHAPLAGWVNNAAIFRDAVLHDDPAVVADLVAANLRPALVGSAAAVRRFREQGSGGAIVNVSSHQAARPVRGALPYATAKAAVEGLTRALAVEYGPAGVRTNAVALGTIETARSAEFLAAQTPERAAEIGAQLARLHPLGRPGRADEVAETVAHLLSGASFVNGAVLPVDGGRAVYGPDPEEV